MYLNTPSTCDRFTQQGKQTSEQRRHKLLGLDKHTRMWRDRGRASRPDCCRLFSGVNIFGVGDVPQDDQK